MNPLWYAESMIEFRHIDDIEDYLEPMDYETFWQEIKGFCLILIPREKCDADIEDGVDEETVLIVLKNCQPLSHTVSQTITPLVLPAPGLLV